MAIKRKKSNHPQDNSQISIPMSPSSSSSTASDTPQNIKRPRKMRKRDDSNNVRSTSSSSASASASSSSSSEGEEGEASRGIQDDQDESADWNQNDRSSIQKKNALLAEHAKRRLSGRYGAIRKSMNFEQPPSSHTSPARATGNGRVGALARARENQAKARQSIGMGGGENPLVISTEVMNNNYDEWMKMATDNKINVNNTWSFALIDYFHDMSLLKNPDSEGGINFQKASCTLDGCVKIWTSRVDSVATETGKLLSGLAEEANNIANQIEEDDQDEEPGDEASLKAPKKPRARTTNSVSLVEFNDKIKVKELELEFTVDPLFKKTCADFDEGGSGGILMSHLSIDSSMTIIFDASGKPFSQNSDDDATPGQDTAEDGPQSLLDVSKLKSTFLDSIESFQARAICPCLSNFKFSTSDSVQAFEGLAALANVSEKFAAPPALDQATNDAGNDFFDSNESPNLGDDNFEIPDPEDVDDEVGDIEETFNPIGVPNQRDLLMALVDDNSKQGDSGPSVFGQESTGMFDYFDKSMKKSWAGPEHWKLRKTVAFKSRDDENQTTTNRPKREKSTFSFDFLKPLENSRKSIFQSSSASLTLPGYKPPKPKSQRKMIKKIVGSKVAIGSKQMLEQHRLPEDMHFNASQLLRFDMKPKTTFSMRVKASGSVAHHPGADIDENYWARTAAAAAAQNNADQANAEEDSAEDIPFATQFFQDEGDDQPDFEEEFDNPVGSVANLEINGDGKVNDLKVKADENDLIAATQNLNVRARPEFINYAKKAKRVDVKRLKENIWRELEDLTSQIDSDLKANHEEEKEEKMEIDKEEGMEKKTKTFTKVINGLRSIYPQDKMEEISTSFCFICLLHLANEKGLRIQSNKGSSKSVDFPPSSPSNSNPNLNKSSDLNHLLDLEDSKFVGKLEELKIFKEPA